MTVARFSFQDKARGWKLNEVSFGEFNLLVGQSGVGKTRIIRALQAVCWGGTENTKSVNGCRWELELAIDEDRYCWSAETSLVKAKSSDSLRKGGDSSDAEASSFIRETVTRNKHETLVERSHDRFLFRGNALPKLKKTESAITLLRDEQFIATIHRALSRFIFSEDFDLTMLMEPESTPWLSFGKMFSRGPLQIAPEVTESLSGECQTLDSLRERSDIPILIKAYLLQKDYAQEFKRLKADYAEIFPTVSDVRIASLHELSPGYAAQFPMMADWFSVGIKEKGIGRWIVGHQMSAGMLRTLIHLFEVTLSASGTVIVIDEVENSLGSNCLPPLIDHFLRRSDLQFILTSHHPYVINNIPWRYWKIVTRKVAEVTVKDASSIPALNDVSSLEKFTQLLNLEEYEEAIR